MSKLFVTLMVTLVILQHGYSMHFDLDNGSKLVDRISRSLLQIETTDSVSIDSPDETDSIDDSLDLESTNVSADSPDSSDSPDNTDDSSESYDSATESPDSQDSVSSDSIEVTSDSSSSSSDSDSLESSSTCNNVLVLSDGFVINDESFSGEYVQNGNGQYNIKGSGNNRIVLELVNDDDSDYELVIGNQNSISSGSGDVIVYNLLLSEWTNENNPLVDGNNNENWSSDDETTTFTVSELTLQDCLGNDLGSELCSDDGTPLFDVYDCVEDENGVFQPETGSGPSTSSATKVPSNLFYFGACLMVILIEYIN